MPAPAQECDESQFQHAPTVSRFAAQQEDAYWERTFWQERYYRPDLDYEDYAPAYCVGYVGCVQYGGDFADAERSLCANWERIKSESRLSLDEAMRAIKAAWDRMASARSRRNATPANEPLFDEVLLRHSRRGPSFAQAAAAGI